MSDGGVCLAPLPATARGVLAPLLANARAALALVAANARYWPTVAPVVCGQLRRWERRAQAIADPELRALALEKLREERFNSEVAATLATVVPFAHRRVAVEAIVALEVMYDYLDGLTEQQVHDPLRDGRRLFLAFTDAVTPDAELSGDYYRHRPGADDGGYLEDLARAVRAGLRRLPAAGGVAAVVQQSAARCAEAQVRAHAALFVGDAQLQQWAQTQAVHSGLRWREFLAGAEASVLAVHALIAAAADPRTSSAQAALLDTVYLSIAALATILDSLVDYERDRAAGESIYIDRYADRALLAQGLTRVVRHATSNARGLPRAAHHAMTIVGVVAYYTSAPTARSSLARPVVADLHRQLRPLIAPTLAVVRTWRAVKRVQSRLSPRAGLS